MQVVVNFESFRFIYTVSLIAPRSAYGDMLAIKEALYEIVAVVLGTVDNLVGSVNVYGDSPICMGVNCGF